MRLSLAILLTNALSPLAFSFPLQAADELHRQIPLSNCGGHIAIEANSWQTVIRLEKVERCPYVKFNGEQQSMRLEGDGSYSQFYVWHEPGKGENLSILIRSATGQAQDEVSLRPSLDLTAGN